MIKNEKQYEITRSWAERFEEAAQNVSEPQTDIDACLAEVFRKSCEDVALELRGQMKDFEERYEKSHGKPFTPK